MADARPEHYLQRGTEIAGQYVIDKPIAAGGVGVIYLARDRSLDRPVAVKLLHASETIAASDDIRFRREARALSKVQHPNIVSIFGYGKHDGARYIVMEYVDGPSLYRLLQERSRLSITEAISIARQVASGLAEVHAHGLVHRDIKPGNILLRRLASGNVIAKVVDFGLSRYQGDEETLKATKEYGIPGTPAYMAPEQVMSGQLDGRADLYALAVVLFEMLTGDVPYSRSLGPGLIFAHVTMPTPALADKHPGPWPAALEREMARALAKNPDDRHPDLVAFAHALATVG